MPKPITVEELAERFLDLSGFYESEDDKLYAMALNPHLAISELEEALFWRDIARGFVGIFGDPGSGKTLLLTAAQLKLYYYFIRPILSDYLPTQAFVDRVEGRFTFIDEEILLTELESVDKLAKNKGFNLSAPQRAEWLAEGKGGKIKLHGCTLALSEIDRWLNCRRTATEINRVLTDMIKQFRHLDIGLWGDCVDIMDLDRQRAVPRFSTIVQATPLGNDYFQYEFRTSRKLTRKGTVFGLEKCKYVLYGPDWYKFYRTRNPVALAPKFMSKKKRQQYLEDKPASVDDEWEDVPQGE
jgi:hypothetical protein